MIYIIVPVYNVEKYLRTCLDSIFQQTINDFIVICVNDGSTDGSLKILEEYRENHSNLVIINKKNGGLSSARNAGLDYINLKEDHLITFVDSDDYLKKDFLEHNLNLMLENDCDLVCSSYKSFEEGTMPKELNEPLIENVFEKEDALFKLISDEIKCHTPCKLYRSKLWDGFRFDENISFLEDEYTTPQIFNKCNKIAVSNYRGYYYLHRSGSLCRSKQTTNKIFDAINAYIFLYNFDFDISDVKKVDLKRVVLDQFFDVYLMMSIRLDIKNLNDSEKEKWFEIKKFVKNSRAFKFYKVTSLKRFVKKTIYFVFPHIYPRIYRLFTKEY